jgi:hypothetical protein
MKNFVMGAIFGSAITGYLTGHIKISAEGIAFVPPASEEEKETSPSDPSPMPKPPVTPPET